MNSFKTYVAGAIALSGTANAQQTLQKITAGTNQTVVELFQIRNGTSNTDVVGPNGYDQGMSQGSGGDILYLESTGLVYDNASAGSIPLENFPAEQIGNGTFEIATTPHVNNKAGKLYNWKDGSNVLPGGELTINTYNTDRDAIEDGNTNADMLHSKWVLPHTFDNGDALPVGLHVILMSRDGYKDTGGTHASKRIGFRWSGSAWVQQTVDPAGDPYDNLEQATLATNEAVSNKTASKLYPNPVLDGFFYDDGNSNKNEKHAYVIYDIAGRQVGQGTLQEGKKVDLSLNKGMYILKTDNGDSKKIIKQ